MAANVEVVRAYATYRIKWPATNISNSFYLRLESVSSVTKKYKSSGQTSEPNLLFIDKDFKLITSTKNHTITLCLNIVPSLSIKSICFGLFFLMRSRDGLFKIFITTHNRVVE